MANKRLSNHELDDAMPQAIAELAPERGEAYARRIARGIIYRERVRKGPTARLQTLAYQKVGDSITFPEYQRTAQIATMVAIAGDRTGARFECTREYSLVDGTPYVRVTLVKEAD